MMRAIEDHLAVAIQRLAKSQKISDITLVVRRTARDLTGADGVTFVLRQNGYCYYADEEAIAPLWKGKRFPASSCVSGWVMAHRQPVAIPDIYRDPRVPHAAYRPTFVKSMAMVPVRDVDPVAAIGAYWARIHDATEQELRILKVLADAAALALNQAQ
jgi:GAF domain-containing protein